MRAAIETASVMHLDPIGIESIIVGMKATFGRISCFGIWASLWSTDQAGPLTKTVEDNALLLEILGAYDPVWSTYPNALFPQHLRPRP